MYIVLVYDIKNADDYSRTANRVFKTCKRYLTHIQNSVFEGDISKTQLLELKILLKQYLRKDIDSCIIFKSYNEKWLDKEFLTNETDKTTNLF